MGGGGGEDGGEGGRRTDIIFVPDVGNDDKAGYAYYTDADQIVIGRGVLFLVYKLGELRKGKEISHTK